MTSLRAYRDMKALGGLAILATMVVAFLGAVAALVLFAGGGL